MAGEVIKVCEHFWRIEEDGVRAFLFEGTDRAMLVDTCFGLSPQKEIVQKLTAQPVFVVNTHTDMDHVGNNKAFDTVYMHPAEMDYYKQRLPEGCRMSAVRPIWEGDVIDLGYWKFEVILTPGHTPGSIMLLERNKRMLISGDSIQKGAIYLFGQGRNIPAFEASLEKISGMSDAFDTIWPSHNDCPVTPEIIPGIQSGLKDLLAGKLEAVQPPHPMPCKVYSCSAASFCYNPEEWENV